MLSAASRFLGDWVRRRAERVLPPGYSWLFVALVDTTTVLALVAAMVQRGRPDLPVSTVAALLVLVPFVLFLLAGIRYQPTLVWVTSFAATAILLFATSTPIRGDIAPAVLVLVLGGVVALAPTLGALALGSAVVLLVLASAAHRLEDLALYLGMVVLAWLMGLLIRTQTRLLIKQRQLQVELTERAAIDERRRIAREVHDLIAHSLSVTLLHVTGARRTLIQDRDIDDAVEALTDAERLGRQAMADVRRTVGLLQTGPSANTPEPGVADIPNLVQDFVQAGLDIALRTSGPTDQVSATVGLALYRITQESLANIAKHAPHSSASVDLVVSPDSALLSVVNEPAVTVGGAAPPAGRGLSGMRQRVELLGGVIDAGPSPRGWSVRAEIPLGDDSDAPSQRGVCRDG